MLKSPDQLPIYPGIMPLKLLSLILLHNEEIKLVESIVKNYLLKTVSRKREENHIKRVDLNKKALN